MSGYYKAFCFVLLCAVLLCGCGGGSAKVELAQKLQESGNYQDALTNYLSAAKSITTRSSVPDKIRGRMGDSDTWIAQIEKYMDEFLFSEAIKDELSPAVIAGIQRCAQSLEPINFPARKTTTPLDSDTFHELWTAVFPPPAQQFQEWEKGLRDAFAGDISFIEITSRKSYIYELSIWNLKTSRRVDFTLYAESTVMLPLPEGAYYVLCRSSVVFSGGQRWESPWSAFALNISPSTLKQLEIRTSVPRRM